MSQTLAPCPKFLPTENLMKHGNNLQVVGLELLGWVFGEKQLPFNFTIKMHLNTLGEKKGEGMHICKLPNLF